MNYGIFLKKDTTQNTLCHFNSLNNFISFIMKLVYLLIISALLWYSKHRLLSRKVTFQPLGYIFLIYEYKHLLTLTQCNVLCNDSISYIKESTVITTNISTNEVINKKQLIRKSMACAMRNDITDYIHHIATILTGYPLSYHEDTQVTYYKEGDYFSLHHDMNIIHPRLKTRVATIIIYLSDQCEGGETNFPDINVSVKPEIGKAILFWNTRDSIPIQESRHSGCIIKKGCKWIAQQWVHSVPYMHLYGPK